MRSQLQQQIPAATGTRLARSAAKYLANNGDLTGTLNILAVSQKNLHWATHQSSLTSFPKLDSSVRVGTIADLSVLEQLAEKCRLNSKGFQMTLLWSLIRH